MPVIFGTTLRPESEPPAVVAAQLAERLGTPLRLVHVCEDPRAPVVLGTDQEYILGSVHEHLNRQAAHLRSVTSATVRPHLAAGPVVSALATLSEIELATVLMVGMGASRLRLVAERLSRVSPTPVIALREPDRFASWLGGQRPLRVLVGADLGRTSEAARTFAARIAALGSVEVEVLLVASPEDTHARLGLEPPAPEGELSEEAEAVLLRDLSRAAPQSEAEVSFRVLSGRGRVAPHIVSRAEQGDVDLVVVGARRNSTLQQVWQDSVARGVLQAAPANVATVPLPIGDTDASYRPPQVVVVGTEFTEVDHRSLIHAVSYARQGGTVHVVHVLDPAGSDIRQAREDASYRLLRLAHDGALDRSVSLQTHVLEGSPAEQLRALSERVGADLLVLGVRSRPRLSRVLLGSVAGALVESSRIPVLLIPSREP